MMTIQDWNWTLICSAITPGLLIVGGFWLRHIVNQQLKLKDATIETLNAAIKLHEAEIASLKAVSVPALVAERKGAFEHAEQMTAQKQRLEEMVAKSTASEEQAARLLPFETNVAETTAIIEIWNMFRNTVGAVDSGEVSLMGLMERIYEFSRQFDTRINDGFRKFEDLRIAYEAHDSVRKLNP